MTDLNYESESAKSTSGSLGASTDSNSRVSSSTFKDTIIVEPALYLPCSNSSDNGSSKSLWIDLLNGLAPNSLLYPSVANIVLLRRIKRFLSLNFLVVCELCLTLSQQSLLLHQVLTHGKQ